MGFPWDFQFFYPMTWGGSKLTVKPNRFVFGQTTAENASSAEPQKRPKKPELAERFATRSSGFVEGFWGCGGCQLYHVGIYL